MYLQQFMMVSLTTNRKLKAIGIFLMAVYVAYTVHEGKAEHHESTADHMQNGRSLLSLSKEEWFAMNGMRFMHIQHSSNPGNVHNNNKQIQWVQEQQQWRQMQQQQQNHLFQP